MGWLTLVGSLVTTGGNIAGAIMGKDANEAAARAAELKAQQDLERAKRNNRIAIIVAIAIVAILGLVILKKA